MNSLSLICLAWFFEACFGWPDGVFKRIKHPVVWLGYIIQWFDTVLNKTKFSHQTRYILGALTTISTIALSTSIASAITYTLPPNIWGLIAQAVIASSLIASRSLYIHILNVLLPLLQNDIHQARNAVSMIVGRDPNSLDESAIVRASIESLAENASDGIIAPIFWGVLLGLPGIAAYKAINTLDSMIGHRSDTYSAFGGFAARLDDVVNLIPARITGCLFVIASLKPISFKTMIRDAPKHRSPNAGWPEASMAGALNIRLSGPRVYGTETHNDPWLNFGAKDPTPHTLQEALKLYLKAMLVGAALLMFLTFARIIF
ncbi:adenosylcobinamide-phosphate synthase CbiB [Hirschia litorea]|uniref:Cobalamin biosynthesis protein CobD n=1 Tax=Hirschia litorea TaxID=1199156 RepID=A0ABW2IHC1_9PROT